MANKFDGMTRYEIEDALCQEFQKRHPIKSVSGVYNLSYWILYSNFLIDEIDSLIKEIG